jgi:hypothetical protein
LTVPSKTQIRVGVAVVVLLSASVVAAGWATRPTRGSAPPADGVTVVTAQGRDVLGDTGRMVAFGPNGDVIAQHDRYDTYFDVDPVEGEPMTVEYVAVEYTHPRNCPDDVRDDHKCAHQYLLRTDLETNETTVFWETYYPKLHKMHDFDRVNDTHVVVADIYRDDVRMVNVETGALTWNWTANESFVYGEEGGTGPTGFTHVNDVEVVRDGWIMASLRNLDRTVFIDPGNGVVENWTIGCEDCYGTLYEHHNSDYMPGDANTPPTVIVADSENDRIVEFRRVDGGWKESWTYTNGRMHWPRDADRLADGHTLVTDSNANRVFELDEDDEIVWETAIGNPYEAERMGTGDESANRPHEPSRVVASGGIDGRILLAIRSIVPSKLLSAALFVGPYWAGVWETLAFTVGALALLGAVVLETKWFVGRRFGSPLARPKRAVAQRFGLRAAADGADEGAPAEGDAATSEDEGATVDGDDGETTPSTGDPGS